MCTAPRGPGIHNRRACVYPARLRTSGALSVYANHLLVYTWPTRVYANPLFVYTLPTLVYANLPFVYTRPALVYTNPPFAYTLPT